MFQANLITLHDESSQVIKYSRPLCERQPTAVVRHLNANRFGALVGASPNMRELFRDLERIAPADLSLLIQGETGTGKELVAESVHQHSPRADKPFVVFDCSSVASSLAESELFGHERGAFTGAVTSRAGVFEQANGGTIFLDELGELPKELQPKLLRVLEKREVRRVGGSKTIPVDVRLISATNRNLRAEVRAGNFREDLYFRVAGAQVNIPPLRDRLSDIPLLAAKFLAQSDPPRNPGDFPEHVWNMLQAYHWPGNVRELRNAVQRMLVSPEGVISADTSCPDALDAEAELDVSGEELLPLRLARRNAADHFERKYLKLLLAKTEGNVTRAAAVADVSRQVIHKLISKHGL